MPSSSASSARPWLWAPDPGQGCDARQACAWGASKAARQITAAGRMRLTSRRRRRHELPAGNYCRICKTHGGLGWPETLLEGLLVFTGGCVGARQLPMAAFPEVHVGVSGTEGNSRT